MKYRYITFSIVLFLLNVFSLRAQVDTRGTDFWLTFGNSYSLSAFSVNLQIRIVGGAQAAQGTIHFTGLSGASASVPFSVDVGQVYTYRLNNAEKGASYNMTMSSVANNRSVRITTDAPVTVYALNQSSSVTDATNILPVPVLGTDYYQISYTPAFYSSPGTVFVGSDAYAVIATQNNTRLYHENTLVATLNMGQVYYRTSPVDMTGAHITADKPVALFAMNMGAEIPNGFRYIDNLFQQLAPVHTWGKNFFVPVSIMGKDIVRVVASQDNTLITQTGGKRINAPYPDAPATYNLNAGQFAEFMVPLSSNGCFIHANKPVGVCTYLASSGYPGNTDASADPAQAWLPSLEQFTNMVIIAPFRSTTTITNHYALIVTPAATKHNTRVKTGLGAEEPLSGGTWHDKTVPFMMYEPISFYSMPLTSNVAYKFTNDSGLIVMAYGYTGGESYYYLASSAMRDLTDLFYVNDIYYKDLASEVICAQPVQFRAEIRSNLNPLPGYLKWYINGMEEISARDKLNWERTFETGVYQIEMEVQWDDNETIKTVTATIKVELPVLDLEDITLCADAISGVISFAGTDIDETTTTWEVIFGSGTEIGMEENAGTGTIPSFKAINTGNTDIPVTIMVTPISPAGCEGEPQAFVIKVDAKVAIDVNLGDDTTICRIDSLILNAGHPNADSYQWQDDSDKVTFTVRSIGGQYWVIVSAYCNEAIDTINVSLYTDLKVNLGEDIAFCEDDMIYRVLDATTFGASSYLWQDEITTSPTFIAKQTGIYSVTVSNVCMSVSDEIEIKIKDCSLLELWLPNAFRPNGDGFNDLFKPEVRNPELLKEYEMAIYNRWGNLVFITRDYLTGWNGKDAKNQDCSEGVYAAIINYKNIEGQSFIKKTAITLIR